MSINKNYRVLKSMGFSIKTEKGVNGWRFLRLISKQGYQHTDYISYRNSFGDDGSEESFEICAFDSNQDRAMRKVLWSVLNGDTRLAA